MICASNTHKQIKWNRWDNGTVLIRFYEPERLDESKDIKQWTMYFHNQMKQRLIELNETADTYNHTVQPKSKRDV